MRTLPLVLSSLLAASAAHAAPPKKITTVEGVTEYALDNGLRVLLFPDSSKPTVTVNVTYFVGSRVEGYGETGMAHLLEHMLFKGTKKRPKLLAQLEQKGARMNGSTWTDRTNYFEILSASDENLKFALDLEADRMVNSKIAKEDLDTEFSVVRNEFEMGENSPQEVLEERMMESAYLWHNYGKPTIGSRSDIERVPIENLRAFYQRWYQPDNAMLVVAGKIDPDKTLKMIGETFGKLPRPKRVLPKTYTVEPVQDGERTVTLRRTGDVQVVGLMYHGVPAADEQFVAETALVDVLTHEPGGRLYQALVAGGLAAKVHGDAYPWAEPGVLEVFADVRAEKSLDAARDKMISVVEGLGKHPITDEEVARFKAKALSEIEIGLTDPERVGVEFSEWAAMGDWRLKFLYRDRVEKLTADEVRQFAAAYLKPANRTLGLFVPTAKPDRSPLPGAVDAAKLVADYKGKAKVDAGEAFVASVDNIEKRTERVTLGNGLKLALLAKKTRGGAVDVVLHVRAGNEKDLRGLEEVSSLVGDAAWRGTKQHNYQQLKDALDQLKVEQKPNMNPFGGGPGTASFHFTTVKESLPKFLPLLAEVVREPTFPAADIEALRKEKLSELEQQLQQPIAQAMIALIQRAQPWPKDDVRYRPTIAEKIDRLKNVKRDQLADFHKNYWGGAGATLVLVGDFDPAQVKKLVGDTLGDWKAPKPFVRVATPYRAATPADDTMKTPDKQMAFVGAAAPFEMRDDDPDYPAMELGDFIFGGGAKSRLWDRLREKEGLSYGAFSFVHADALDQNGLFFAGAICAPQNAVKAMNGLVDELKKLFDKGVPDGELSDMKKAYQARFDNEIANDGAVAMLLDESVFVGRPLTFYKDLNAKIQKLSGAQVVNVLKKRVSLDSLVKIKAGDIP